MADIKTLDDLKSAVSTSAPEAQDSFKREPVRDAQGRIVPGAQPTTTDRARDPATGREFQTAPAPTRPH